MRLLLMFSLILVFSCKQEETTNERAPSSASGSSSSTTGLSARWSSSTLASPLSIKVSNSFDSDFTSGDYDSDGRGPMRQMMKLWNESTTLYTFFELDEATVANKDYSNLTDYYYQDSGQYGIYKSFNWFSDVTSAALAVTQYYGTKKTDSTGSQYVEIIHADIILNYSQYTFTMDRFDYSSYDLPTVVLHELGHLLGLGHYNHLYAVMAPTLASYEVKRDLFYDKSNIHSLYGSNNLAVKGLVSNQNKTIVTSHEDDGEVVRGVIELMPNGDCLHYLENELIEKHNTKLQ